MSNFELEYSLRRNFFIFVLCTPVCCLFRQLILVWYSAFGTLIWYCCELPWTSKGRVAMLAFIPTAMNRRTASQHDRFHVTAMLRFSAIGLIASITVSLNRILRDAFAHFATFILTYCNIVPTALNRRTASILNFAFNILSTYTHIFIVMKTSLRSI